MQKMLFVAVAPPASHPRMASLLGDVADLKFFPHSAVSQPCNCPGCLQAPPNVFTHMCGKKGRRQEIPHLLQQIHLLSPLPRAGRVRSPPPTRIGSPQHMAGGPCPSFVRDSCQKKRALTRTRLLFFAAVSLGLQAESADRAYVELPDAVDKVDSSFIPELLRCLKKGGSLCVRYWSNFRSRVLLKLDVSTSCLPDLHTLCLPLWANQRIQPQGCS